MNRTTALAALLLVGAQGLALAQTQTPAPGYGSAPNPPPAAASGPSLLPGAGGHRQPTRDEVQERLGAANAAKDAQRTKETDDLYNELMRKTDPKTQGK